MKSHFVEGKHLSACEALNGRNVSVNSIVSAEESTELCQQFLWRVTLHSFQLESQ